ncbi:MAG: SDR family NAD(P)-dependent oxidoreductase [Candidatus Binatia bacterium]
MKGRVAMVTGASRGIGRAIAFAFAVEGTALALCSRKEKEIKKTAKEISSRYGVKVHAEARDLTKSNAVEGFVRGTVKALGTIDILVNNVGGGISAAFDELAEKDWQAAWEKNFWVALSCCRATVPLMRSRGSGKIINIAALSGKVPRQGQIGSNVAKAALINLTESLACEVGRYGIRVNAVCPAAILTERWENRVRNMAREKGKDYDTTLKEVAQIRIPAGRFGLPEDVAHLVVFLASDRSDFINGVSIEVDGGLGRFVTW